MHIAAGAQVAACLSSENAIFSNIILESHSTDAELVGCSLLVIKMVRFCVGLLCIPIMARCL